MKKRILFIALFTMFLLGGCVEKNIKETVISTYMAWREMQLEIWAYGISEDTGETYRFGEGYYYKVNDEKFQSIEDIKKAMEEICTPKFAETMYYEKYLGDTPMYLEESSSLYRLQSDLILTYGSQLADFGIIKQEKGYIHARLKFNDDYLEEIQTIDLEIVLEDGRWLVNNVTRVD